MRRACLQGIGGLKSISFKSPKVYDTRGTRCTLHCQQAMPGCTPGQLPTSRSRCAGFSILRASLSCGSHSCRSRQLPQQPAAKGPELHCTVLGSVAQGETRWESLFAARPPKERAGRSLRASAQRFPARSQLATSNWPRSVGFPGLCRPCPHLRPTRPKHHPARTPLQHRSWVHLKWTPMSTTRSRPGRPWRRLPHGPAPQHRSGPSGPHGQGAAASNQQPLWPAPPPAGLLHRPNGRSTRNATRNCHLGKGLRIACKALMVVTATWDDAQREGPSDACR